MGPVSKMRKLRLTKGKCFVQGGTDRRQTQESDCKSVNCHIEMKHEGGKEAHCAGALSNSPDPRNLHFLISN